MSTRHFDYLTNDDAGDFFQKVAMDQSGVRANQQPPMVKTAAATPVKASRVLTPFEKVAGRLDRDLEMLKTAGECGVNAGMQKRANAYIDVVVANAELTPEQLGEVFDKVAGLAIQTDLLAAYDQLCDGLPEREHEVVDDVLIKIGKELVELALVEKDALLKIALSGASIGKMFHGIEEVGHAAQAAKNVERAEHAAQAAKTIGLPAGEMGLKSQVRAGAGAAKGYASHALGAPKRLWNRAKEVGVAQNAQRMATARAQRMSKAQSSIPNLEAARTKAQAAEAAGGARGAAARGAGKAIDKDLASARHNANPKPRAAAEPSTKASETAAKTDTERQQGADKAETAARPPGQPPKEPPKAGGESGSAGGDEGSGGHATPPPPGGADGKPPGFMDAWKKATEGGWKGLSAAEKGVLIRGGVTGALVARAVTGHGAITGGEGLI